MLAEALTAAQAPVTLLFDQVRVSGERWVYQPVHRRTWLIEFLLESVFAPERRRYVQRAFWPRPWEPKPYKSLKFTSMVAMTETAWPSFIPGRNFQRCTASIAF